MILASHQSVAGGGYSYSGSNIATHGAQGQEPGLAAAGSPYASIFGSPAYGASPLPMVNSVAHPARHSPEFFGEAGSNGSTGQHRSARASASIAGSPTGMPGPFHAHFQMQHQRQQDQLRQQLLLQQQHYLASPAFTDGSPPSTASSAVLVHPRGRTSPRFTALGRRARGTPVPNGVGRFGMFPAVMPSVSFPAPDGSTIGGGGIGESGGDAGAARLGIPPTPPRGRHPSTGRPQVSSLHQNHQFRPVVASRHHHPHQQQQHHDHQTPRGDQQPTAANAVGAEPTGTAVAGVAPHGQGVAATAMAAASATTAAVAAPSPPPLLRLSPRRPRMGAGGRGARPSTPVMGPAFAGFSAGGNGGGACDGEDAGGGGADVGQPFIDSCGAGTRARSGSVPIGRARSGSGHRRLRIPSLHGGRRRLRSRSNSYDVVPTSRSGSPGMFVLGNASPKAGGGGGGGVVERKSSGAFWGGKGWPSSRRPQGMASWDEVDDDVSDIFTRCRPGSEDWGGSGDWPSDAFERSFRNGPSIAPTLTGQQHGPANLRAAAATTTTTTAPPVSIVSENASGGNGGSGELPRPPSQLKRQAAEQQQQEPQQQQERNGSQQHEEDLQQRQQQQHGGNQDGQQTPPPPQQQQQQQQSQQEEGQERLAPHFHLSFDDETSESEQGGGSGDEDHDSDSNDSSSYADSEELDGVEAGANAGGGRPRGRGFWPMLYCQ
ncbi:unnamed protein product [Ectocarpus fasciculatus]